MKYLTGGDDSLQLKQRRIKFNDPINKLDGNNDEMVTKKEMETFLSKNLKPNKDKDNGKIIETILYFLYNNEPDDEIGKKKLHSMLKNGITIQKPYNDNSAFMKNTLSK